MNFLQLNRPMQFSFCKTRKKKKRNNNECRSHFEIYIKTVCKRDKCVINLYVKLP